MLQVATYPRLMLASISFSSDTVFGLAIVLLSKKVIQQQQQSRRMQLLAVRLGLCDKPETETCFVAFCSIREEFADLQNGLNGKK